MKTIIVSQHKKNTRLEIIKTVNRKSVCKNSVCCGDIMCVSLWFALSYIISLSTRRSCIFTRVCLSEKLKFTPVPQPSQCLQLDRESSVSCVAKGRETPVIRWSRAGQTLKHTAQLLYYGTIREHSEPEKKHFVCWAVLTETEWLSVALQWCLSRFLTCVSTDGADLPSHVRQTNGVLQFSTVTRADGGNYTCVASNSAQGEIRAHVHLTVGGVCLCSDRTLWLMTSCSTHALTYSLCVLSVHVEFKLEPEQTTVYQGHTAVLHCQALGDPQPYVQWMLKDKLLSGSSSSRSEISPHLSVSHIQDLTILHIDVLIVFIQVSEDAQRLSGH